MGGVRVCSGVGAKLGAAAGSPPLILGVGVGGTFEKAALLSKKALFREVGSANPDLALDALEKELLARANRLGIGPPGYGGRTPSRGIPPLPPPLDIPPLPCPRPRQSAPPRHP